MYHKLEKPGCALCHPQPGYVRYVLPAAVFRAQIEFLKSSGWRGVSVAEAIRFHEDNVVAITFDGSETDLFCGARLARSRIRRHLLHRKRLDGSMRLARR